MHALSVSPKNSRHGFTIVELLIVIVIIGILAAITIVAYNGITSKAHIATLQSDLHNAADTLEIANTTNGSYPADLASANLPASSGTSYQYTVNNSASPATYCVTATNNNISYFINNTTQSTPAPGGCPGDGVNGVPPITNYALDPEAASSTSNFFLSMGTGLAPVTSTISSAESHSGSTSLEVSATGSGYIGAAAIVPTNSLKALTGQKVSWSFWVYPSVSGSINTYMEGSKVSDGSYMGCGSGSNTLTANTWQQITGSCSFVADTYVTHAGAYGFSAVAGTNVWFDQYMITIGSTQYKFADGDTANWKWNGTPNSSSSTGPQLP